jgi:hypothetical protein
MMMEAAWASETLVNFYQTAWRYNSEDSHLRTHRRRENLKSYINIIIIEDTITTIISTIYCSTFVPTSGQILQEVKHNNIHYIAGCML